MQVHCLVRLFMYMYLIICIRWPVTITVQLKKKKHFSQRQTIRGTGDYFLTTEDYWLGLHVFTFLAMCANTECIFATFVTFVNANSAPHLFAVLIIIPAIVEKKNKKTMTY